MTTVPLNDLQRAASDQEPALRDAVQAVVASGWYVHGPQHRAFEQEFADYTRSGHCVGVASGTDALGIALTAAASGARDVVVTAANAGAYTSVAALGSGLRPRFADVDPATHCLDPAALEPLLQPDVCAVVVTHLYGRVADVEPLRELCDGAGVVLVEDCAQATGAHAGGTPVGSFGTVATFSFYPTKNLGALGDGGAITTDDPLLADRLRALRQYGWTSKYLIEVDRGRNSRLDEVQAAVLRVRLPLLEAGNERRRQIVRRYRSAAGGSVVVLDAPDGHVAHLAVMECDDRAAAQLALSAAGVESDVHYPVPDHRQPTLAHLHDGRALPVTERLADRVLTLPCFPQLTDAEVDRVCDVLASL